VTSAVSPEEELEGLDLGEHGASAYPDFQTVPDHAWEPLPSGPAGGVPAYAKGKEVSA
jgi:Amt family ammonium transporter